MGWTSFLLLLCLIGTGISQRAGRRRGRFPAGKSEVVGFNCPEDFGYYPHPSDCALYYVCVFGGALQESCTGGLVYSHELQTCDWPRNVECKLAGASSGVSTVRVTDPRTSNTAPLRSATESLTPSVSNFFQQDSRFGFDNSFSSSQNFQSSSKFPVFEGGEEKSVAGRQGRLFNHEEQDSPQSLSPRFSPKSDSLLQETAGSTNRPRSATASSSNFRSATFPTRTESRRPSSSSSSKSPSSSSTPSRFSIALGSTTRAPATVPPALVGDSIYSDLFNFTDADYFYYYDELLYDDYYDVVPATTQKSIRQPATASPRVRVPVKQTQSQPSVHLTPRSRGGSRAPSPSTSSSSLATQSSASPSSALRSSQSRQSRPLTSSSKPSSQRGSSSSSRHSASSSTFPSSSSSFPPSSPAATSRRVSSTTPSRGGLSEIFHELTDKDFASIQSSNSHSSRSRINSASSGSQSSQALRKAQQANVDSRAKSRTSSSRGGTSVSQRTQSQASRQTEAIKSARTSAKTISNTRSSSSPLTSSFPSSSSKARSSSSSSRGSSSRNTGQRQKSEAPSPPPTTDGSVAQRSTRPTLKPVSQVAPSAAKPSNDIWRFPPKRPQSLYPRPPVDIKATKCDPKTCILPDCYCGGKEVPGGLAPEEIPQLVLLTFDDAVNDLNKGLYKDLYEVGRKNPNGCPIAATYYVSHEWTDYSQVQNLYADGHEMASHSVSHSFGEQFSTTKWAREVAGQREILSAYGGVKMEDVRGMRAPFLAVGGNKMFRMLYEQNFTYDSSMPVYENNPPSFPYTLDYRIFHDCMIPPCPSHSFPGVWEVPMVMWQDLTGGRCSMGDACTTPPDAEGVYKMLIKNFERHYTSNRAPFGLYYHAAWFTTPHHKEGFIAFLDTITAMEDVWLVTTWQALQWTRNPVPISQARAFPPFQCNYSDRPKKCGRPRVCNVWHKGGVRYMRTCQQCPESYPWTGKTGVKSPLNVV